MTRPILSAIAVVVCSSFAPPQASNLMVREHAERARAILRKGIESKDSDVRVQAIISASMIGRNEVLRKRLEALLQDKNVQVRIAAVHALADLKFPLSTTALENTLRHDQVPEVAFAAAKALYTLQDSVGGQALMDIYDGKINPASNFLKEKSRDFFGNFHSIQSATMFVVNEGIGYVPVPGVGEGFSAMEELLSDPDLSARASVVLLLAKQKNAQSADLLKRSLTDRDWSVRAAGTQMIAHTGRSELTEMLVPLFDDKKEKVRFQAAGAYLHLYLKAAK